MLSNAIVKYILVGLGGYLVYLVLLIGMVEGLDLDPVLATFLSLIPVVIISYTLNRNWVYQSKINHRTSFSRYIIIITIAQMLNLLIMYITTHWFDWWYLYSQILVVLVVTLNNFLFNHLWTFKR